MNTRFKLIAASLAAPLAIGLAVPALAAPHTNWDRDQREYRDRDDNHDLDDYRQGRHTDRSAARNIERRIEQLRYDTRNAQRAGELTRQEAITARSRLDAVERAYFAFARNGLDRRDIRNVNYRIDQANEVLHLLATNNDYRGNRRDRGFGSYNSRY